jgi:hypothetical protein
MRPQYRPVCTTGMPRASSSAGLVNPAWILRDGLVLYEEDDKSYSVLRPLYDLWEDYVGTDVVATYPSMDAVDAAFLDDTLGLTE